MNEGNNTERPDAIDELENTISPQGTLGNAEIENLQTQDGDGEVIPYPNNEEVPLTPEEIKMIQDLSLDIDFVEKEARGENNLAKIATLSNTFAEAEIEGQTAEVSQTSQLLKRIKDYVSERGRKFAAATAIGLASLAPQVVEAGKFDIASFTGNGGGLEQIGKVLEKGQNLSHYEQQIKGVQGQIDANVNEMNRLNDESKRAEQILHIQSTGQNRQVGGEISAQDKVNTAQERAQVAELEGQIKLENARFKKDYPTPDEVATVEHQNRVQRIKSQIDILIANAQASHMRQDNVKAGVNTQGEFAGVDLAARIQSNNDRIRALDRYNLQLKESINQIRLRQGQEVIK